ncbi:MAG TPA: aminoacetone oxidase family FAD-binding enzyme [Chitinispirillaceae bacterium]|nr:aminoacetone oxidase family FAD-binding enzyme [Chitinispirillaceae bacterium]
MIIFRAMNKQVIVAGGGAAGCFAAITIKELAPSTQVVLLENSGELLHKVALSGGGRCNCTNGNFDRQTLSRVYPRGAGFLRSVFSRFDNQSTVEWFKNKGVVLKTEPDGRVFPQADRSSAITGLFKELINTLHIDCLLKKGINDVRTTDDGKQFRVVTTDGETLPCDYICIATGGTPQSGGIEIARALGHEVVPQIPSLYSFQTDDPYLSQLSGIAVPDVLITLPEFKISQTGDILITHRGISGPAVIRLSSLAAREIHEKKYDFSCRINWCADQNCDELYGILDTNRRKNASLLIEKQPVVKIPSRLWKYITAHAGCTERQLWAHLSSRQREMIIQQLTRFPLHICGRDQNKDEFVTCGGISCSDIDSRTMESKRIQHMFFAGEIIDIDALTGGYNLQAAWSTGWQVGVSIAESINRE